MNAPFKKPAATTLTVTAKGQVTLKKDLLNHLGVQPGDKVTLHARSDGGVEIKATPKKTLSWNDLAGSLRPPAGVRLTIEEMDEAIGNAVVEEYERGLRSR